MFTKKTQSVQLYKLLEQKIILKSELKLAQVKKQTTKVAIKKAKLYLINRQWRYIASITSANNDVFY